MARPEKKITKPDIAVILFVICLLAASLFIYFRPAESGEKIKITSEKGTEYYSLSDYRSIDLYSGGIKITVSVTDKGVAVTEAGCPDRVCIHTGTISRPGQSIVCIPAGVVIEICGNGGEAGEDFIVG